MKNKALYIGLFSVSIFVAIAYFLYAKFRKEKADLAQKEQPLPPPPPPPPPPPTGTLYDPLSDGAAIIRNRALELHNSSESQNLRSSEGIGAAEKIFVGLKDADAYDATANEADLNFYVSGFSGNTAFLSFLEKVRLANNSENLVYDDVVYISPFGKEKYDNFALQGQSKLQRKMLVTGGQLSYLSDAKKFAANVAAENDRYNYLLTAKAISSLRSAGWKFIGYDAI